MQHVYNSAHPIVLETISTMRVAQGACLVRSPMATPDPHPHLRQRRAVLVGRSLFQVLEALRRDGKQLHHRKAQALGGSRGSDSRVQVRDANTPNGVTPSRSACTTTAKAVALQNA